MQIVYKAAGELKDSKKGYDVVTIIGRLKQHNYLDEDFRLRS